ncbi:MAG: glycosyltransferase [Bacteroidetes bacterium HGW-Bacteroidetes-1]|jgi:glycosyltransferase involved in cell wall biosynthesis|nr:MAG: glycosyltransferase [Bacteroidetes bacterium HGW-Bacteroidetes-1]
MKIFVLLSRIPWPLEKGDKLRAYHQIKELAKKNEIVLCALNSDPKADKQRAFKALQPFCRSINFIDLPFHGIIFNLLRAWVFGKPLQTGYFYNSKAERKVKRLILHHQPDVLYGQLLRVAEYLRHNSLPKVLDYQDIFSQGMFRRFQVASLFLKPFLRAEYLRLKSYEADVFDDFDIKTIISFPDRDLIPHSDRDKILVVPNGVDHDYFKPIEVEKKYDIVFTGNMAYPPNVNAAEFLAEEIMPLVWKVLPQTMILIAGATPDKKVRNLASDRIHVSGWLDDIRMAYAESRVFIAPMRIGTGLQNKLLEAMSMKLPCVTTVLANDALKGLNGEELFVGENASELADFIIQLLKNEGKANLIAQNGYDFVHRHFDWASSIRKLEQSLQSIIEK